MILRFLRVIFCMTAIFSNIPVFSLENSPKVVVIGGGLAGLTTAYRLHKDGMNVELYEARGRVGGRVFTAKVNGSIAELGGQNIGDGGEAVNLNRLIDEFGLKRTLSRVDLMYSYFNGIDFISFYEILKSKNIDSNTFEKKLNDLASTSFNMQEILEQIVTPEDPLYKILDVRISAYEGGNIDKLSPLYKETLFHMLLGGLCSVHQADKGERHYVDLLTIEGGNSLLPKKIGETLGEKLHLNMPLTKVSKNENGSFQLTFENGIKAQADILVLAIPCSVYENISFEGDIIPNSKLEDIVKIKYGTNAKIIVPFKTDPLAATGLIGDEMITYFDKVQKLLTVYCTGNTSLFSPQTISQTYIKASSLIERGLENCPSFTNVTYVKDTDNLSYQGPIGYSWPNDPYVKGSYSYIASGQENVLTATVEKNGETFKSLFSPLEENLYFAGEHTSILFDVPGTMESACESGERIARAILKKQLPIN